MTEEAKSNKEKIAILYRFLQDNMRYVSVQLGIGGWQTYDAQYVEQNKYGDCKALSNFMKAMLKTLDIPAYTAAVYGDSRGVPLEAEEDFSFPLFNHVIYIFPMKKYG
ncbi:MAG: transglutaminase domain-containing protein [Saprospiraceae bacterium]|nr:transglutaminase domain-containing protein [Saprospiraceae bacterium]